MNEYQVKLHFVNEVFKDHAVLGGILTNNNPETPIGVKNPLPLKVRGGRLVRVETSDTRKVDPHGNTFENETSEVLQRFKEKETERIQNEIKNIKTILKEENLLKAFKQDAQLNLVKNKRYLELIDLIKKTPCTNAHSVISLSIVGDYTTEVEDTIREGVKLFLDFTKEENEILAIEILPAI